MSCILGADGIAVLLERAHTVLCLLHAVSVYLSPCALASIRTGPAEGADAQTLHGSHPYAADYVLALVYILHVSALTVEDAHLIVEVVVSVGCLEQIALQLYADVASVA